MHTPLPWIVGTGACDNAIYSEDDIWIADCVEGSSADNAALIVRAVNSHSDLVAALRTLLIQTINIRVAPADRQTAIEMAEAALAKATGGGE